MDYGNLLSRAWRIVWNNKFLFVLGFLAALGGGGGGGGGAGSNAQFSFGSGDFGITRGNIDDLTRFFARYGSLMLGLACAGVVILVVLWLVRLTAQAGLISAVARIDAGEKLSFGEAFSAGISKLGRMVGINAIMYGPFTLVGFIAAAFALATAGTAILNTLAGGSTRDIEAIVGSLGFLAFCFACLACLMIPLIILVTAIYPFAQRGAVLQDLGVTDSISHGWNIVRQNLGDVILLIVLFVVLSFVFGFVLAIVLIPFAFLALGPAIIDIVSSDIVRAVDVVLIVAGGICLGLLAAAINAFMVAFRSTAVTLAYQEFVKRAE